MSNYTWLTDTHLDHLDEKSIVNFGKTVASTGATGIFWTGDISNGPRLISHLAAFEQAVQRPIYFVLGNHDYYGSQIEFQRKRLGELANISPYLKYMPNSSYLTLSPLTAVVGHDGWYDAFHGDPMRGTFILNDWNMINEYVSAKGIVDIIGISRKLAHEGTLHVMKGIKSATRYARNIIVLTHVPPFKEAATYRGRPSDEDALPWYTSKMMGDMLTDAAKSFPNHTFTVLCGHTHGKAEHHPTKNMVVRVGEAKYGAPAVQGLIDVA